MINMTETFWNHGDAFRFPFSSDKMSLTHTCWCESLGGGWLEFVSTRCDDLTTLVTWEKIEIQIDSLSSSPPSAQSSLSFSKPWLYLAEETNIHQCFQRLIAPWGRNIIKHCRELQRLQFGMGAMRVSADIPQTTQRQRKHSSFVIGQSEN